MQAILGLVVVLLALIGALTILRATARVIMRAAYAAKAVVSDAWRSVAGTWRSWVASRDKRRAWRREGIRRLEIETVHALVYELASVRSELAELRATSARASDTLIVPRSQPRA
jgi:hypothetical protein